ncbi:hypothetical protein B0H16DRAFT_1507570 [Mycena metata]|uniref:Uncharacterized protein n=1 Tax=Mycena metata TaxID=1033252 RepID=A0AAD7K4C9_9AGAR|nr:hypothetical protein B0H16DRAFT_1507570 [Mycena metata]
MQLFTALLTSFLSVAVANPLVAREPSGLHCDLAPFLNCKGGIDQQIACGDDWKCPGNGLHPIIANHKCAAECVCEIPCP